MGEYIICVDLRGLLVVAKEIPGTETGGPLNDRAARSLSAHARFRVTCDLVLQKALSCLDSGSRGQAFRASFRSLPARFPLLDKLGLGLRIDGS